MATSVYLDHNATTPPAPGVVEAMATASREQFGNASSIHAHGQRAKAAIDEARTAVAVLIGAEPGDIVFTAGGTEADNLAVRGALDAAPSGRRRLVVSAIEHEAVLNTAKALERRGWAVTVLPVDAGGVVSPAALDAALGDDVALVSVMLANNETGAVQPVAELARLARARRSLCHTDAVQAVGKVRVDVRALGVDMLSVAAHKFGGPKGVGALWIRRGTPLSAVMTGGRQERNRRAGTENVPAIVGFGVAARLTAAKLEAEASRLAGLRDRLEAGVLGAVPGTAVNAAEAARVPNTTNIAFDRVEAEYSFAAIFVRDSAGAAIAERIPMTATTNISSISVKPRVVPSLITAPGTFRSSCSIPTATGRLAARSGRQPPMLGLSVRSRQNERDAQPDRPTRHPSHLSATLRRELYWMGVEPAGAPTWVTATAAAVFW